MKTRSALYETYCQEIALKYFDREFDLPVYISDEMPKSRYGQYSSRKIRKGGKIVGHTGVSIAINKSYNFNYEELYDTLKHEVCHWACQMSGKAYKDGSINFESELYRIGASSTRMNSKEASTAYQEKVISGAVNRLGDTAFKFKEVPYGNFHSNYEVTYKGVKLGYIGKWNYGKYKWSPVSENADHGNLCWTTRKHAVKQLLRDYEIYNGQV